MFARCVLIAAALTLTPCAAAAPFVPARDPQVVAWSPDGKLVATGVSGLSDGAFPPRPHPDVRKCAVVAVFEAETGRRLWRAETFGDFTRLAFSPDGTLLAASRLFATEDGVALPQVQIWQAETGKSQTALDGCQAFDFSPDGKTLAVSTPRKCVLYQVGPWEKIRNVEPLGGAFSLRFIDDATLLGVCKEAEGCVIKSAHTADGKLAGASPPQPEPFYALAVAPKSGLVATGHLGAVQLWNGKTLELLGKIDTGEPGYAQPFFSPDGGLLAAGCHGRGDVVIWDLGQRKEAYRYTFEKGGLKTHYPRTEADKFRPERGPERYVFSPSGEAFLAGPFGGIIRLVTTGQEVRRLGE